MKAAGLLMLAATGLGGCAAGFDLSPPGGGGGAAWAIERQVARCRATQSGGSRTAGADLGGVALFGTVTAVSRTESPEDCDPILHLTDGDVGEIRTLMTATAASARGLETHWRSAASARREIILSVYPVEARGGRPCRVVAATLTVYAPAGAMFGAPPALSLDEQRFCRAAGGAWEPG
jgi:hypothetical protein